MRLCYLPIFSASLDNQAPAGKYHITRLFICASDIPRFRHRSEGRKKKEPDWVSHCPIDASIGRIYEILLAIAMRQDGRKTAAVVNGRHWTMLFLYEESVRGWIYFIVVTIRQRCCVTCKCTISGPMDWPSGIAITFLLYWMFNIIYEVPWVQFYFSLLI